MKSEIQKTVVNFAERKYLKKKYNISYTVEDNVFCLYIDKPIVLSRFAAELRQAMFKEWPSAVLLCRGQTRKNLLMYPSLFRNHTKNYKVSTLLNAEELLVKKVRSFKLKRFDRPDVPALLQHYGVKTSWLDVVDNLFVAIWFATHRFDDKTNRYKLTNKGEEGWIYFLSTESDAGSLEYNDLRGSQHHLSVRPHIQHGWSITRKSPSWNNSSPDISEFLLSAVCFKNSPEWTLNSGPISTENLFPNSSDDNTLKALEEKKINEVLREIENQVGLKSKSLGSLFQPTIAYKNSAR